MSTVANHEDGDPAAAPRAMGRTAARLAAVQALFQIDSTGTDPQAAVQEFLAHRLGAADTGEGSPILGTPTRASSPRSSWERRCARARSTR